MRTIKIIAHEKVLFMNYSDENGILQVRQEKGTCITLQDLISYIILSGLWDEMLKDARAFERVFPYTIECTTRPSGAKEYFLQKYSDIFNDGRMLPFKRVHLLHVSMFNKLNEGIRIFGPDLIALLQGIEQLRDFVYQYLKEEDNSVHYYEMAEMPTSAQPNGKYFFFPNEEEMTRLQELAALFLEFKLQSRACWEGCKRYILEWPEPRRDITPYLEKCDESIRSQISSLTEKDFLLMRSDLLLLRSTYEYFKQKEATALAVPDENECISIKRAQE